MLIASPAQSPALDALSAVHHLAKRSSPLHGLAALVVEAQVLVGAAEREGRGKGVEQECSGWSSTLRYCEGSSSDADGTECFCSSTALERMEVCKAALAAELQGAFADFAAYCDSTSTLPSDRLPSSASAHIGSSSHPRSRGRLARQEALRRRSSTV
ncbi:hypothetical protein JCM10213_002152 [Rhodosporidiobolus nylandii]